MRPLTLEITGIGPFVDTQRVDFSALDDRALFLIHGPTGQGKTFLFDAICYALYSETPAGREGHLKSDFLKDGVEPVIDFTFKLGFDSYRVRRTLKYERPRSRGNGVTIAAETHSLIQLDPRGSGDEVLSEKKSEVNSRLKELLGLELGQFRQVVMIPQGDFRDLLLSRSEDRETLLENLFDTALYRDLQQRLKLMEDEADHEELSFADRRERIEEELSELWHLENLVLPDAPFAVNLAAADAELTKNAENLARQDGERSAVRDRAVTWSEKARALHADHQRLTELEIFRIELESKISLMDGIRKRLNISRRAFALKDSLKELLNARKAVEQAAMESKQAAARLESIRKQKTELDTRSVELPLWRERIDILDRRIRLTEGLRDENSLRQSLNSKLEDTENLLRQTATARQKWQERQDSAVRLREEIDRKLASLAEGNSSEGRHQSVRQLELLLESREKLSRLEDSLKSSELRVSEVLGRKNEAEDKLEDSRALREANIAGELASNLVDGKPCPVCGSVHHPSPASVEGALLLTVVEHAEKAFMELNSALVEARTTAETEAALIESQKKEIDKMEGLLKMDLRRIPERIQELNDEIEQEREFRLERDRLLGTVLPELSAESERLTLEAGRHQQDLKNLRLKLDESDTKWALVLSKWPADDSDPRPSLPELPGYLNDWLEEKAKLESLLAALEQKNRGISEGLNSAETDVAVRGEHRQNAVDNLALREQGFSSLLAESEFADEQALVLALESAGTVDQDALNLDSWTTQTTENSVRIKEISQRIDGQPIPDLAAIDEAGQIAVAAAEESSRHLAAIRESLRRHKDRQTEYREMEGLVRERERRNAILRKLSGQVRGTLPPKISLNRFFLARRLEEVLIQATLRLSLLSRGRFTLKRRDEGKTAGAKAGLDLMISDSWTGTERPVNTLSGGQLFMASLSLALGLADVVQARSGGVKLEALFIDEGFGTLDEDALQGVMQVLNDLRENRMVGVISHVPDLKRQIANRIEVCRKDPGSSVRLVTDM